MGRKPRLKITLRTYEEISIREAKQLKAFIHDYLQSHKDFRGCASRSFCRPPEGSPAEVFQQSTYKIGDDTKVVVKYHAMNPELTSSDRRAAQISVDLTSQLENRTNVKIARAITTRLGIADLYFFDASLLR